MRTGDLDICANCRHWSKGTNQPRNKESFTDEGGECRKHPPRGGRFDVYQHKGTKKDLDLVSVVCFPFPPTHQLDWCSEWDACIPQETAERSDG